MKRWAFVVAALYLLILLALVAPGILLAFMGKDGTSGNIAETYSSWPFWALLLVLAASQFALLAVPVRMAGRRPVTRGPVWSTIIAGALMCGVLAGGAVLSIIAFAFNDDAPWGDEMNILRMAGAAGLVSWAAWALVFNRVSRTLAPGELMKRQSRGLIKGSILELLIAVPTHIVARQRDSCCADAMTFIGIVFGVAVMLFAYGPAVFFLFAERWRRLHPDTHTDPSPAVQGLSPK